MKICATVLLGPGSENTVPDAIASVIQSVDGFALIDAGGGQAAVAAAMTAACTKRTHYSRFSWTGSYSDARNAALQQAELHGYDYAVTVDTDERVNLHPELLRILSATPDCKVWSMRDRDLGYAKERILKCNAGLRWHGRVCENVEEPEQLIMPGNFWELKKSPEGDRARWERGIVETQRMIAEGDDRYKWWRHQGSCRAGIGDMPGALGCYEEALKRAGNPEETAWSTYLICEQLVLRGDHDKARDMAAQALAEHAGFVPEFGWILAYTQFKAGNLQNASRWAQLVVNCPVDTTRVGNRGTNCKSGAKQLLSILHATERPDFIELSGVRIAVTPRFSDKMIKVMMAGAYEAAEAKLLDGLLRPDDRVLELGAGCGYLSTLAAKKLGAGAVMAVEADPALKEACKATFKENGVEVELMQFAVTGESLRTVHLNRASDFWSSRLSAEPLQTTVAVTSATLADLLVAHPATVIVCDIEGAERDICGTALPPAVRAVLIEVHSPELETQVGAWMTREGLQRVSIADRTILYERAA